MSALAAGRSESKGTTAVVPSDPLSLCFAGMFVSGRRVLMSSLTVLVSGVRVLLRLVVLACIVEVSGLQMVMGRGLMMGGRLMMMLARRMLGLRCHDVVPLDFSEEPHPGRNSDRMRVPSL
jgi:hypothetical protein